MSKDNLSFSLKDNFEGQLNDITTYTQTPNVDAIKKSSRGEEITKNDLETFLIIF